MRLVLGFTFLLLHIFLNRVSSQPSYANMIPFVQDSNYTATHDEIIDFYRKTGEVSNYVQISEIGHSDIGRPLHLVVIASDNDFNPDKNLNKGKAILMINNAIHPGEPCGVDASMLFTRDILNQPELLNLLDSVTIIIIPAYNVGGVLNRNSNSRANQDGPKEYGFRGNAQNLDLNRDFIKADSKNSSVFAKVFTAWRPHVFMDTHTTNGADYSYTMTLISSQKDQLGGPMGRLMRRKIMPKLYEDMSSAGWEMSPYVYSKKYPKDGIMDFNDSPRYSTGYAALHHSMGFVSEAHMLKPYKDRVMATYEIIKCLAEYTANNSSDIVTSQKEQIKFYMQRNTLELNWSLDESKCDSFLFRGYTRKELPSKWSEGTRMYYDHNEPYEDSIAYWTDYKSNLKINLPQAYIIPSAYDEVINKLSDNNTEFRVLDKDTLLQVEMYRILDYKSRKTPYEGHYLHHNIEVEKTKVESLFYKGDYIIETSQVNIRYIVSCLEPESVDSWFAWNFFDGILMQKEHFSPYVFEDTAERILNENPELKQKLEERKAEDPEFAGSHYFQLEFIYKNSPHYEKSHGLYPVGRIMN